MYFKNLFLLLFIAQPCFASYVIYNRSVFIPRGSSQWIHTLSQPKTMNPFKISFLKNKDCPNLVISLKIKNNTSEILDVQPNPGGWIYHTGGMIDAILINFYQYQYQSMYCEIQIEGKM